MKRHRHPLNNPNCTLWEAICDMDNLKLAHENAKKGKGWYKEVIMVDSNPEYYLNLLQEMLIDKTYRTSEYEMFIKKDSGKERTIYKLPYFPDRICQWAIMQVIEPILINNFTKDTYSAIPGRGVHPIVKQLRGYHKKINKNEHVYVPSIFMNDPQGTQYTLKLDVQKYYPSIDHEILKSKYRRLFKDKDLLWLLDEIIDSASTIEDISDIILLEEDVDEVGIPIGNYLSQYSGNLYLSSFDHWIKEVKGVKYYFRYMDDVTIFGKSKEELHQLKKEIEEYFTNKLNLTIKHDWQVFPTFIRGVDFVGYRFFFNYTLLRKSTCKNFKRKMLNLIKKTSSGKELNYSEWCSINSYKGWLKWCDSYRLSEKYITPIQPYADDYYETKIKTKGGKKDGQSWNGKKHCKTKRTCG